MFVNIIYNYIIKIFFDYNFLLTLIIFWYLYYTVQIFCYELNSITEVNQKYFEFFEIALIFYKTHMYYKLVNQLNILNRKLWIKSTGPMTNIWSVC